MAFRLTPEAQARADQYKEWLEKKRWQFERMTDGSLAVSTEYYMRQAAPKNYAPGEPVYDATLWHVILPELLKRLREHANNT